MLSFSKNILKELLDFELEKGLIIKISPDSINKKKSNSKDALDTFTQTFMFDAISSLLKSETECDSDQKSKLYQCSKSCNLPTATSKSEIILNVEFLEETQGLFHDIDCRTIAVEPKKCTQCNKRKSKFSDIKKVQLDDSKNPPEVKPGDARTRLVMNGNGDGKHRKFRRRKSIDDDIYILVNNKKESNQNKQHKMQVRKRNKAKSVETQQHYHVKQKNMFNKTIDPSKYLKQILELPNKKGYKDNVIGPIPIQAEGLTELTRHIEQLVHDSGNGVVQRKLKLCKAGEDSDNCLELDVNIRKISFEEITDCVKPKKSRSIFSPFFCFSARSDSEDHLQKHLGISCGKQKSDLSKSSCSSVSKNKISWRMNIPFFEKFRLNPKCCSCSVKILKCGPVPGVDVCKETVRTRTVRSSQHSVSKPNNSPCSSESLELTLKKYRPFCDEPRTVRYVKQLSTRWDRKNSIEVKDSRNFPRYQSDSMSLTSQTACGDMTEATFNSHGTRYIKTLSPLVCREIYLTPTDCEDIKEFPVFNKDQRDSSTCISNNENHISEMVQLKSDGQISMTHPSQIENETLNKLTSSFLKLYGVYVQSQFQKAFEAEKINFVNPYELEKRIVKKFSIGNKVLIRRSFKVKKSNFTKYFLSSLCVAKVPSFEDVGVKSPCFMSALDISIHVHDHDIKDFFKRYKVEADKAVETSTKQLNYVILNDKQVKSIKPKWKVAQRGMKKVPESYKRVKGNTANENAMSFKRQNNVFPNLPRSNLPVRTSKGDGNKKRPGTVKTNKKSSVPSCALKSVLVQNAVVEKADPIKIDQYESTKKLTSIAEESVDEKPSHKTTPEDVTNSNKLNVIQQLFVENSDTNAPYDVEKKLKTRREEILRKLTKK